MDVKLSKPQFDSIVEGAYPTYLLKVNEQCFTRCVKFNPSDYKPKPLKQRASEGLASLIKGEPEHEILIEAKLSDGES